MNLLSNLQDLFLYSGRFIEFGETGIGVIFNSTLGSPEANMGNPSLMSYDRLT